MNAVTTLPKANELTREDLDAMPDDGRRYELIDGVIIVSASPSNRHQGIVVNLLVLLKASCPADLRIRPAPFDVTLSDRTTVEPDVVVARHADLEDRGLPVAPVLAVEVLSPSTRWLDLGAKKDRYEAAGCASYWVVDPGSATTPPSIVAWELADEGYVEVARATGDEEWQAERPFPVTIVPNQLLDD